jgi:MoaA/NifB/PqqE/SkfB family radical SAM enzyme
MKTFDTRYVPPQIGWRITSRCNYGRCRFCYAPCTGNDSSAEITSRIADAIIEQSRIFSDKTGGKLRLVISGGEPLTCDSTVSTIKRISGLGIKVTLSTNGYLLLDRFGDYAEHLDIIALPLEGAQLRNDDIRGEGHHSRVINILEHASTRDVKTKIETVILPDTTADDLDYIKAECERYGVRAWKLFAYNHYPNRNEYCSSEAVDFMVTNPIIDQWLKTNSERWLVYESIESRSKRHFIINPNGDIVIPVLDAATCMFSDVVLSNAIDDFEEGINLWWDCCNLVELRNHEERMNSNYAGLYSDECPDSYLTAFDLDLLIRGCLHAGVSRVYFGEAGRHSFRLAPSANGSGVQLDRLDHYLQHYAHNSVTIISYGMDTGSQYLDAFLRNVYVTNSNYAFKFTLVLPKLNSYALKAITQSTGLDFVSQIYNTRKIVSETKSGILAEIQDDTIRSQINKNICVKYSEDILFGSTILIDDNIIQTETKYLGVMEPFNLIIELRKSETGDNYFEKQLDGIRVTVSKSSDKQHSYGPLGKALVDVATILSTVTAVVLAIYSLFYEGVAPVVANAIICLLIAFIKTYDTFSQSRAVLSEWFRSLQKPHV